MGYQLHITRATDWLDSASNPISQPEWKAFTRRVPGLRPEGWIDWSDIGRQPVFAWTCDDGTVARLAESLNANLVGDEHERYEPKP